MPKTSINYQKSVIYKIQHLDKSELLYIGSTTDFIKRKHRHKYYCMNINNIDHKYFNIKLYKTMRENGGWEQFNIIIIKEFPCNNKIELLIEEDKIMREMKASLNSQYAHMTDEQYKILKQKKNKTYREKHKEELKEKKNKKTICICGGSYCESGKQRHFKTNKHINYIFKY
jgi:hypothetical protein